ncbi:NAD(P)H-binding protein [Dickeya fangzhongdai]|uniref:NAD(P)H-binding protein n=1 Tax=Dickeya fangzhongdai TaxID=1778540 RepID=UPI0026DFC47F|nr:NAD(P)H-binding protein [Dickeya fangzhongdai]WKV52252.1 NAD(P)H-binding protein [Dickeya fangzhongdai]
MRIGVSGAGGQLGNAIIAELTKRTGNSSVVGISRSPENIQISVEGRRGDYNQPESLRSAYSGLDRLLIIPSPDLQPGIRGAQYITAINAAVTSGVEHIVLLSSVLAEPVEEPDIGASFWKAEQYLKENAKSWTILRMNYYAESFAQWASMLLGSGSSVLPGLGENRTAFVARDDVAAAAAGILLGDGHAGATYHATGEESVSGQARAALVSEISGKPLRFVVTTAERMSGELALAGMSEVYVNAVIGIEQHSVDGSYDIVTDDVERLTGRKPRAFRDVLSACLK